MVEFWGRVILDNNLELEEGLVVRSLANVFDIGDRIFTSSIKGKAFDSAAFVCEAV